MHAGGHQGKMFPQAVSLSLSRSLYLSLSLEHTQLVKAELQPEAEYIVTVCSNYSVSVLL